MYKLETDGNYYATIVSLNQVRKHENADKLAIWTVHNFDVITDLSYNEGDIAVFFPLESQINHDLLSYLNMYSDAELNADKTKKGYVHKSGRVRAVKLRDKLSEGLVIKFDLIASWALTKGYTITPKVDTKFDYIDKLWICKKYIAPINEPRNTGTGPKIKVNVNEFIIDGQFNFHDKTPQLQHEIDSLLPSDIISISVKTHGTSAVYSNVLTKSKLGFFQKLFKTKPDREYTKMYSSRTVLKFIESKYHTKEQGFYNTDIWGVVYEDIKDKIDYGYTLYGEIVGKMPNGNFIQKGYDYTRLLRDKPYNFLVYKITYTTPQGNVIELDWNQMEDYCKRFDLDVVKCYYLGSAAMRFAYHQDTMEEWRKGVIDELKKLIEKDCPYCHNKVPYEGVVLRIEKARPKRMKLKSTAFRLHESGQLDKGEVDIEENN